MQLTQLRVLVAIAKSGSFSEAALELDLAQSSVSRAIASLEADLGVKLLHRGRFGASLTPIGEQIVSHASQMLALEADINRDVEAARGMARVRVASFRSAATHILPSKVAAFRSRYPQVEVSLIETDPLGVEDALRTARVDIGLVPLPRSSEFITWEIARDEYVVLLPPTRRPLPERLSWAELAAYPFILYNYAECTTVVREHWARWGQALTTAYEVKEDSTIVSMVAQGLGAAILPRLAALPIPSGVSVRSLPVRLERIIGAAMWAEGKQSAAVFHFLSALQPSPTLNQP